MLTTARPLFLDLPATYADPAGLADQQAEGALSLVVVRYPGGTSGETGEDPTAATYDAYVAASGALLAVARTTPDYRFPVTPATALARFQTARAAAQSDPEAITPTLSLYALDESDCARFLESAYFAECLKLHVDGSGSAALVADQLARCGCSSGLLEINDFSEGATPRVALLDLDALLDAADAPTDGLADALADALAPHLDGFAGRALLYDRAKNRATLPDRAGHGFGLEAALEQAARLAEARRQPAAAPRVDDPDPAPGDLPPDPAEIALTQEPEHAEPEHAEPEHAEPEHAEPEHAEAPATPSAPSALSALVAELQGTRPATAPLQTDADATLSLAVLDENAPDEGATDESAFLQPGLTAEESAPFSVGEDPTPAGTRQGASTETGHGDPSSGPPASDAPVPAATPPHPLGVDLDRLRVEVAALFEDAVGRDRARQHEAHVLETLGLSSPAPPEHAVSFLRALLTADPPRRWHLFKRARGRAYAAVSDRLMAFHVAHGGEPDSRAQAAVQEVAALWTRLHR